jgi:hypothetical protein
MTTTHCSAAAGRQLFAAVLLLTAMVAGFPEPGATDLLSGGQVPPQILINRFIRRWDSGVGKLDGVVR